MAIDDDLGAGEAGYSLEDELRGDPPRPRPPELKGGRHALRQRRAISGLVVAGLLCWGLAQTPIVETWGLYFLPLRYLSWIGLALLGVTARVFLAHRFGRGPYRYVEEGVPIVARVRSLDLRPSALMNGQPSSYRYVATIEHPDPVTGEPQISEVMSNEIPAAVKDGMTTTYRVGDLATAVYLPTDPVRSLRLYGFLDLRPGLGLVRRDGGPGAGPLKTALSVVLAFGFLSALVWDLYAMGRFSPIRMTSAQVLPPLAAGAVVLGGSMFWLMAREVRRKGQTVADGEASGPSPAGEGRSGGRKLGGLLIALAGLMLIGGLTSLCWCYTANALLDTSPPKRRPVKILRMVSVTHRLIFREYKIEYQFLDGDAATHSLLSSPAQMARFRIPLAVAEVRRGRLGWPWVDDLVPIGPIPPGPDEADLP